MGAGSSALKGDNKKHPRPPSGPRQLCLVDLSAGRHPSGVGVSVVPLFMPSALPPPPDYLEAMSPVPAGANHTGESSRRYAWFVENLDCPGEWEPYSADTCERLDMAMIDRKQTCMVLLKRHVYTVDFRKMEQVGSGSGVRPRRVKRVEVEMTASEMHEKRYIAVDPFIEAPSDDVGVDLDESEGIEKGDELVLDARNNIKDNNNNKTCGEVRDNRDVNSVVFPRLVRSVRAHLQMAFTLSFSADGERLLTGTRRQLLNWEVTTAMVVTCFAVDGVVLSSEYSPSGNHVLSGGDYHVIRMYNTTEPEVQREFLGHTNKVYGLGYLAGEECFASVSMDKTLRCWDVETGVSLRTVECHKESVFTLATSKEKGWFAITGGGDNVLFTHDFRLSTSSDGVGGSVTASFVYHCKPVWTCALHGNEQQFASGGVDASVLVWDIRRPNEPLLCARQHTRPVHFLEYMPYGRGLLSCSRDSTMRLTNASTAEPVWRTKAHMGTVFRARYHAGTEMFATSGGDATVNLWEYQNKDMW